MRTQMWLAFVAGGLFACAVIAGCPSSNAASGIKYYGVYRGTVVNNVDPELLGRLQVQVPDVLGTTAAWALPCVSAERLNAGVPAAGTSGVASVGANAWIAFEGGDPNLPVCLGFRWTVNAP